MALALSHTYSTCTKCQAMEQETARLRAEVARLEWDETIGMLNSAGGYRAIDALPDGEYALVFCDIDYLKQINNATGNHVQTNRYLAEGLRVRPGEIAIRLMGDEFLFILCPQPTAPLPAMFERRRRAGVDPVAFVSRLAHQLASQPLNERERSKLPSGVLSATFAWQAGVAKQDIRATIEALSQDVLAQKEARI
jgi:GGDEF domain-containing protein